MLLGIHLEDADMAAQKLRMAGDLLREAEELVSSVRLGAEVWSGPHADAARSEMSDLVDGLHAARIGFTDLSTRLRQEIEMQRRVGGA